MIRDSVIYGLLEKYQEYVGKLNNKIKNMYPEIVLRCELKILEQFIFMKSNPVLIGVKVIKNMLKLGAKLSAVSGDINLCLGRVVSMQKNKKDVHIAKKNE
jgi:translation initiation factor 5B